MKASRKPTVLVGIVAAAVAGVALLFSAITAVVAMLFARGVLKPPTSRGQDTGVVSVDQKKGTITFSRSDDAVTDGRLSFWFQEARGHAQIGHILSETADTVTRELLHVSFGDIGTAKRGRFNGWFYLYPSDIGVEYEDVIVETEVGPAPAWLVHANNERGPGDENRWAIQVHGRAVMRAEAIRAIPVFRDHGYTSLLISYRNDFEAPPSDDNRYSLGDTEWRDIEAAMGFAKDHGATSIVLMGWSMGGATVLQTLTRSPLATMVRGVVLDSPVIDWVNALDFQARARKLIWPLPNLAYAMMQSAWGRPFTGLRNPIDLGRLDFVRRAADLSVPILLMHSDDDLYVPSGPSRALAEERPDIVTFEAFHVARHTKLWNYDPERWNRAISEWLRALPGRSAQPNARKARSQRQQVTE